jgi:hypothetical protein
MQAFASIFFSSCAFFTLTVLFRQLLGLDVDSIALALASVFFGTSLFFLGKLILRLKASSGGSKG